MYFDIPVSMQRRDYDFVFITHLPSFYKTNLFNEVSKELSVLAIYLGETSQERTSDFVNGNKAFDYIYLNSGDFEKRNHFVTSWKLIRILMTIKYKKISVGAWDLVESWVAIFVSAVEKNALAQESTIFESSIVGWKGFLKKLFVKRISSALVSGMPQLRLMNAVGFDGEIVVTGGVGLANRGKRARVSKKYSGRFLYVGRLSPEKNVELLVRTFSGIENAMPSLTLVGEGQEREYLESISPENVTFLGGVSNELLGEVYERHDALILPSKSEVWGLVVEEALYYGLPVLVSNRVGSFEDLVGKYNSGLSFDPESEGSLKHAIEQLANQYDVYSTAAASIDFAYRDHEQVKAYVKATS